MWRNKYHILTVKKPEEAAIIEDYFAQIDEPRKSEVLELHRLITQAVPQPKPARERDYRLW